jgi:hypothetical protein
MTWNKSDDRLHKMTCSRGRPGQGTEKWAKDPRIGFGDQDSWTLAAQIVCCAAQSMSESGQFGRFSHVRDESA